MIKSVSKVLMIVMMPVLLCIGCTEHIDESNLYTFTGETIEDFLVNRDDQYSNFNYILSRIGYDRCFPLMAHTLVSHRTTMLSSPTLTASTTTCQTRNCPTTE